MSACAPTSQLEALEAHVTALESEKGELEKMVAELENTLGSLVEALPAAVDRSGVESEIDSLRLDVDHAVDLATDSLDASAAMASCVNDYMDTIARWSSNISTFYEYSYC